MAQNLLSDRERKCPVCGKMFILNDEGWAYKRIQGHKQKYFCSWHCLQAFIQSRPIPVAVETRDKIIECIKKGMSTSDIVRTLGVEKSKVKYWMDWVMREGGEQNGSLEG